MGITHGGCLIVRQTCFRNLRSRKSS